MRNLIFFAVATIALAQPAAAPKPEGTLKEQYWHAIAAYYQQNGLFQRSLSDQQKKLQEAVAKIESDIGELRIKLKAECAKNKQDFDETGTDAECKAPMVKPAAGQ